MKKSTVLITALLLTCMLSMVIPVDAHHSFAMFDVSKHKLIEGHVTDWHFNNPHSWLHIKAPDENGEIQTWSFEGAAIVHAARQGVTGTTFKRGEFVRIVMSPMRTRPRAGALCFVVKEDGSIATPNDAVCAAAEVIKAWKSNGWLENGRHLDIHPA